MYKGTIYFSCDPLYYENHGRALVDSCLKYGENVIVNIDTPNHFVDSEVMEKGVVFTNTNFTAKYKKAQKRTVWASSRFLHMPNHNTKGLLIVDADCFLRKPIDWSDFDNVDYSLFLRDPLPNTVGIEKEGTRVAAGAVYVANNEFKQYFQNHLSEAIDDYIQKLEGTWFIDQLALWKLHDFYKSQGFGRFKQMPSKYIDWNFYENTTIHTGKGNRKTQEKYLNERSKHS